MQKSLIYQMLPRLWGKRTSAQTKGGSIDQNGTGKFSDIDQATFDWIRSLGMDYVWYTGIIRHSTVERTQGCIPSHPQFVKGRAGSPYAICDYYDVNPYLANDPSDRMKEFEDLVRRTHQNGLKVIIDFVPNHVARDYGKYQSPFMPVGTIPLGAEDNKEVHWCAENDFFYYPGRELTLPNNSKFLSETPGESLYWEYPAKASGNIYSPEPGINDWYETIRINYCDFHTVTWEKMLDIVLFWASKGVDGFRCDMVELVPWQFFQWMIQKVKSRYPDLVFIAEVYDKNLYSKYCNEVGFDLLYDKSGLYDVLYAIEHGYSSARQITWNWQSLGDSLPPYLLNFLENHDEPRFPSDDFGKDRKRTFAPLYVSLLFGQSPFMVYFGEELGERGMDDEGFSGMNNRTTIFDWWSPDSVRKILSGDMTEEDRAYLEKFRSALLLCANENAFKTGKTFDLGYCNGEWSGFNPDKHFAFLRSDSIKTFLVVSNFSDEDAKMSISIPEEAFTNLGLASTVGKSINVSVAAHDGTVIEL